jgi:hypothetical protein
MDTRLPNGIRLVGAKPLYSPRHSLTAAAMVRIAAIAAVE